MLRGQPTTKVKTMFDNNELARNAPGMSLKDDMPMVDMAAMRRFRLGRLQAEIQSRGCAAAILRGPINIRYATGTRSGQIFAMHHPSRTVVVPGTGGCTIFGWSSGGFAPETVKEIRPMPLADYFPAGTKSEAKIDHLAKEIAAFVRELDAGNLTALDISEPGLIHALEAQGLEVIRAEPLVEHATAIKCEEEIACLLQAVTVADTAMARMRRALEPGMTENELFAVLQHTNIALGGEWIEYRAVAAGGSINPWHAETGDKVIRAGGLVAFDCGLIGPHGYSADVSRTFFCEPGRPSAHQKQLYSLAYENIQKNLELVKAGVTFAELSAKSWMPPDEYIPHRYTMMMHGIGMGDEWPSIPWPIDWEADGYDGVLEENMVMCVESFIGSERGGEGVKLEEQVVVTADGYQNMSTFPYESLLLE